VEFGVRFDIVVENVLPEALTKISVGLTWLSLRIQNPRATMGNPPLFVIVPVT